MSIEEQRKRWKEGKRKKAEDERRKEREIELEELLKSIKAKDRHRYNCIVFIYRSIVQAFGEEKAKETRWQSDIKLPLDGSFGDVGILDDIRFFEYGGSLCLLGQKDYMERLYTDYYTVDIIFAAEEKLKNEIRENEIKQKEILLKKECEERKKRRIEEQEKLALQNKEILTPWWQELYIFIKKCFQT